ncbi:MAG TPA: hypothetical protein DEH78_25335 [Solibacterales bacterium]|nr:hypothetical protein [Bryobacterales bacterium]
MLALVFAGFTLLGPPAVQRETFHWSGSLGRGETIEILGVSGSLRTDASVDGDVHVMAVKEGRRDDPDRVEIEISSHSQGVTLCTAYPGSGPCRPGAAEPVETSSDVRVNYVVLLPKGVRLVARDLEGAAIHYNRDSSKCSEPLRRSAFSSPTTSRTSSRRSASS